MPMTLKQLLSRLSFRQMQVFQAVYELQGYGRAAEALGLTQPAVSSQIRKLEQALDQPLFEYVGRQLYCTRAGEMVAQRINAVFEQVASLQADLHSLRGTVVRGAEPVCGEYSAICRAPPAAALSEPLPDS